MFALESRTFEQRFGRTCPFCGEPWSSEKRCGPRGPEDYTIRQSLKALFADRVSNCLICDKAMPAGRKHCYECAKPRNRAINREAVKRYRERNQVEKRCVVCGSRFSTHKADQRFCTISCANRNRYRNRV